MDGFKRKLSAFVSKHGKGLVIGWSLLLLGVIVTLVLFYGITTGWHNVWLWFTTSRYAYYCYFGALIYIAFLVEFARYTKIRSVTNNDGK